jgi:hypothetical protein
LNALLLSILAIDLLEEQEDVVPPLVEDPPVNLPPPRLRPKGKRGAVDEDRLNTKQQLSLAYAVGLLKHLPFPKLNERIPFPTFSMASVTT